MLAVVRAVMVAGAIRAGGSIVLTSGTAGQRPGPGWSLGASVCGAIDAVTRELALELAPVRVNAVVPGVTRSALWGGMSREDEQAMYGGLAATLPVGRVGEPSDVALAYLYAMEQPMATGRSILVDGGAVLVCRGATADDVRVFHDAIWAMEAVTCGAAPRVRAVARGAADLVGGFRAGDSGGVAARVTSGVAARVTGRVGTWSAGGVGAGPAGGVFIRRTAGVGGRGGEEVGAVRSDVVFAAGGRQ